MMQATEPRAQQSSLLEPPMEHIVCGLCAALLSSWPRVAGTRGWYRAGFECTTSCGAAAVGFGVLGGWGWQPGLG